MVTNVKYIPGCFTLICSVGMLLIGVVGTVVPCFLSDCKDAHHYCGNCKKKVGVHKPCQKEFTKYLGN